MILTRRGALRALLLSAGLEAFVDVRAGRPAVEGAARLAATTPSPGSPATTLSSRELDDLVAFAEALLGDGRALRPDERQHVVDHVEYRVARDPYFLGLYRTTVTVLEQLAGARFSSLDPRRRLEVIAQHRLASSRVRPDEPRGPHSEETREVRTRAVRDLIGGYYNSPSGWAAAGYDVAPGQCGDLDRYTRPET